jgi:glycosyltransferase involved in cell wall biosynthesis
MKIVVFSINPIFPDKITGGASKHLFHIARFLGEKGHQVEILCAQSKENPTAFNWAGNVRVLPILPFHLPFPQPYAISGGALALMVRRLREALETADRFYIHDGEWLIPDVYKEIPTTSSFRDNIYPESVLGSFISRADEIICVSNYSADVIEMTVGQFYPGISERLHRINNGIDFSVFYPQKPAKLAGELGVNLKKDKILLHPHRQEQGKGLSETIRVTDRLVNHYKIKNIKVLVPHGINEMVSTGESDYHLEMLGLMGSLGVRDNFIFIPWLPNERMPELYSLGDVTLCLGSFVEAFGNVAYESLACGTPSIVARVGVHRTLLPDDLIGKVHYGDVDTAAAIAAEILISGKMQKQEVLDYLRDNLDYKKQVHSYSEIITLSQKKEPLPFSHVINDFSQKYTVAPWCYFDGERIFHDFKATFDVAKALSSLARRSQIFSQSEAQEAGILKAQWQSWIDKTWIVPVNAY